MFVIELTYVKPLDEVDKYLPKHVDFLKKQYDAGFFLASGRKVPRSGGVILARADNRQVMEDILNEDPFRVNGVAMYEITEFIPTMTAAELSFLKQK